MHPLSGNTVSYLCGCVCFAKPVMPVQPPVREPEEEMEAGRESQLPEANGLVGRQQGENGRGEEETIGESTEERESDLDVSEEEEDEDEEEEEEEESSGKIQVH